MKAHRNLLRPPSKGLELESEIRVLFFFADGEAEEQRGGAGAAHCEDYMEPCWDQQRAPLHADD